MRKVPHALHLAALSLSLALSSCATFSSDMYIVKHLSPSEKSDLLYKRGESLFIAQIDAKKNYALIPAAREMFVEAVNADPMNKKAAAFILKIDKFRSNLLETNVAAAKKLLQKSSRTESEDFALCDAVNTALIVSRYDMEVLSVNVSCGNVRSRLLETRVKALSDIDRKLSGTPTAKAVDQAYPKAAVLIKEILRVDPKNGKALASRKRFNVLFAARADGDIKNARAAIAKSSFTSAEAAIKKAEQSCVKAGIPVPGEITVLKYQIYFKWAQYHLSKNRFESADQMVTKALQVSRTAEALALQSKISSSTEKRDADSDAGSILSDISDRIDSGDLSGAWDQIASYSGKFKVQANKDKLETKKKDIQSKLSSIYQKGIDQYNNEEYDDARDSFRMVVNINPDYEQASAYLDRASAKLRALEGGN